MTKKAGNNAFLKKYNETVILDLIRIHKSITKYDISKLTGLSPTAVGIITKSLIEKEYIQEVGIGESKGGRKPVLLQLKPESFYSIGFDLDVNSLNTILIDTTGNVIYEENIELAKAPEYGFVYETIKSILTRILKERSIRIDMLLGIGVSIPGIVDSNELRVILAPNLGWQDKQIDEIVMMGKTIPIYIENEAMASAICENWIGECRDISNFVCINIKTGIGAGIFTGGKPYRGFAGSAGEVGHIVVDEKGSRCACGNYGCLETICSTSALVNKALREIEKGKKSIIAVISENNQISITDIVNAAIDGDKVCMNILIQSSNYLALGISSIINTLNPEKIVIGKDFIKYSDIVLNHVKDVVSKKALKYPAANVEIVSSKIGEKTSTLGAAILPLKNLFGR